MALVSKGIFGMSYFRAQNDPFDARPLPMKMWSTARQLYHNELCFVEHLFRYQENPTRDSSRPPCFVNLMPPEILAEIFRQFLYLSDDAPFDVPFISVLPRNHADPKILGHVCQYWRNIVLSLPQLWATIVVNFPRNCHLKTVCEWLDRAHSHTLSIHITQSLYPDRQEKEATDALLSLLLTRYSYWNSLNLALSSIVPRLLLCPPSIPGPQNLESVKIDVRCLEDGEAMKVDILWRILHLSPKLRRIDWGNCYHRLTSHKRFSNPHHNLPSHTPWKQLADITLKITLTLPGLLNIFQACPQIEAVWIGDFRDFSSTRQPQGHIKLDFLHYLFIHSKTSVSFLLEGLTLPSLRSLHLGFHNIDSSTPRGSEALKHLVARSSCHLQELVLSDNGMDESEVPEFLSGLFLKSLRRLKISAPRISEVVILALTRTIEYQEIKSIMPDLLSLELNTCWAGEGALIRLVTSWMDSARYRSTVGDLCCGITEITGRKFFLRGAKGEEMRIYMRTDSL